MINQEGGAVEQLNEKVAAADLKIANAEESVAAVKSQLDKAEKEGTIDDVIKISKSLSEETEIVESLKRYRANLESQRLEAERADAQPELEKIAHAALRNAEAEEASIEALVKAAKAFDKATKLFEERVGATNTAIGQLQELAKSVDLDPALFAEISREDLLEFRMHGEADLVLPVTQGTQRALMAASRGCQVRI